MVQRRRRFLKLWEDFYPTILLGGLARSRELGALSVPGEMRVVAIPKGFNTLMVPFH